MLETPTLLSDIKQRVIFNMAHQAFSAAKYPEVSYTPSWHPEDLTCCESDDEGNRLALSFTGSTLVAANLVWDSVFDSWSRDPNELFAKAPSIIQQQAKENCLPYLFDNPASQTSNAVSEDRPCANLALWVSPEGNGTTSFIDSGFFDNDLFQESFLTSEDERAEYHAEMTEISSEEKLLAYFKEDSAADTTGLSGLWGDKKDSFHYPTSGEHEFSKSPDLVGAPFCHFKHLEHSEIYIKKQLKLTSEQEQAAIAIAKRRLFLLGENNWDTRMHLTSEEWVTLKGESSPQNLSNRLSSLGINPPLNAER